jgi:hypothetical protein
MIPRIVPILGSVFSALGLGSLWWYFSLPEESKARADKLANEHAWRIYERSLNELTRQQIDDIRDRVRRQFGS